MAFAWASPTVDLSFSWETHFVMLLSGRRDGQEPAPGTIHGNIHLKLKQPRTLTKLSLHFVNAYHVSFPNGDRYSGERRPQTCICFEEPRYFASGEHTVPFALLCYVADQVGLAYDIDGRHGFRLRAVVTITAVDSEGKIFEKTMPKLPHSYDQVPTKMGSRSGGLSVITVPVDSSQQLAPPLDVRINNHADLFGVYRCSFSSFTFTVGSLLDFQFELLDPPHDLNILRVTGIIRQDGKWQSPDPKYRDYTLAGKDFKFFVLEGPHSAPYLEVFKGVPASMKATARLPFHAELEQTSLPDEIGRVPFTCTHRLMVKILVAHAGRVQEVTIKRSVDIATCYWVSSARRISNSRC